MKKVKIILKTISIGVLGGIIFNLLLFPLPWVLGRAFLFPFLLFSEPK